MRLVSELGNLGKAALSSVDGHYSICLLSDSKLTCGYQVLPVLVSWLVDNYHYGAYCPSFISSYAPYYIYFM